jgi:hypothetical protein
VTPRPYDRLLRVACVAGASLAAAGCGTIVGKGATEASLSAIREQQASTGEEEPVAKVAGEQAVEGAARELASPETTEQIAKAIDAAMEQALESLHRELAGGEGRLARDVAATAEGISAAALRGAERQLDELLAGCEGLDRRACLEREARAVGREASGGLVDGLLSARAFLAVAALCAVAALAILLVRTGWRALVREARPRSSGRRARA